MKAFLELSAALTIVLIPAASALDSDRHRVADIMDTNGTITHVTGLHYCYDDKEGEDVFVNKFDMLYVQRGEAVIKVLFENISRIEFEGAVVEKDGKLLRKAEILTRAGKRVEAFVLCHKQCYINGKVELGEFDIDLEKISWMKFSGKEAELGAFFEASLFPRAETPGGTIPLVVSEDGTVTIDGSNEETKGKTLKELLSGSGKAVFLKVEPLVPYAVFRRAVKNIRAAGAGRIILGP